ncbi:hypothetical protein AAAT56_08930 [Odoribacter splanchnicus]
MRIAKNELLAGIPVLKIRDYFRLLYSGDGGSATIGNSVAGGV